MKPRIHALAVRLSILLALALPVAARASQYAFSARGDQALINDQSFKVIGLRCSNALISDRTARQLIENLNAFKACGVNTVSVYLMGSRFGDVKGYRPDASLDPAIAARLGRIIEAADARGMIVLVGCLYWSDSKAKEELKAWKQADAERAVANAARWLKERNYRNVFLDPDNEGMAHREAGFDIAKMIDAAHAAWPELAVAYNDKDAPPANADLLIHHSPRVKGRVWIQAEGSPNNAPGGYWGSYSKQKGLYQYINIGVHNEAMKDDTYRQTRRDVEQWNGYMLASTWLQCVAPEGPQQNAGGMGTKDDPGVRWWLEFVKNTYGAWNPPTPAGESEKSEPRKVALWDRFEFSLKRPAASADPYRDIALKVTATRPDGSPLKLEGFHDGGDDWKIRIMPDQPGRWRFSAQYSDAAAQAAEGSFECVASDLATGPLAQQTGNPLWFGARSGKPIQLRSFHCGDRFFAANWPAADRKAFLDWAEAQGYNMLSVASCFLNRRAKDRGLGWETPNLWDDKSRRPNPEEYRKFEAFLEDLARRGIYVHPFAGFFGQSSNFPQDPKDQEVYVRYSLARLAPYWNLLFNIAGPEPIHHEKQFYNAMNAEDINRLGALITRLDPYHHLLSVHNATGDNPLLNEPWETYVTLQGWKDRNWKRIHNGMMKNHGSKPLLAHEVFWPGNTLGHGEFTDDDIRKKAWVLLFSAVTINFGDMKGNSSSGFSGTLALKDKIQKRHDIVRQAWDLFETFPFQRLRPRPDLVSAGFCLADGDAPRLVYLPEGGEVEIKLPGGQPAQGTWINPARPAERRPARAEGKTFKAPEGDSDWLLQLQAGAAH